MAKNPTQPQDKYVLRLPDGMRDKLKKAAARRLRTMNTEIIARLEGSFRGWPRITLSDDLFERVQAAAFDKRMAMEKEIEAFVIKVVERELPAPHELYRDADTAFERMLAKLPAEDRKRFREEFNELSRSVRKAALKEDTE